VLTAVLLSACGGGSANSSTTSPPSGVVNGHAVKGLYGALPKSGTPSGGGTITMGQISGDTPTYLFPYVPSQYATDGTGFLISQLYIPLYNLQVGGTFEINYATSAAEKPTFSDGDRKVTIRLRSGVRWSDGKPVTADDVLFSIAMLKAAVKQSAANWDQYTRGLIPDDIQAATAPNPHTVVLTFTRQYNPAYVLGDQLAYTLYPLPSAEWDVDRAGGPHLNWHDPATAAKIYTYLNKAGSSLSTFATSPLWKTVDGPFKLGAFSTVNGSFTLHANPRYTLTGKVRYQTLKVESYTSTTSQINALRAGDLDVGVVDFSELGEVSTLHSAGFSVFGYPNIGTFGIILNYKDTVGHFNKIIAQRYVRQALAHLEDQPAYIKGAASAAYGPLPSLPPTPYTPKSAGTPVYPYSISDAAKLLRSHGWKVASGGQTTCAKAGSGPGECGAGIPHGTPLKFNLVATPASETDSIPLESDAFASAAKQVGINIAVQTKTFNYQIANYNDGNHADKRYENDWAASNWGEYGTTAYPTENTYFNTGGVSNFGGYSDPTADRLIHQAIYGHKASVSTTIASYLAKDVPELFLPCADVLDAVSNKVGGTSDSFLAMTQDVFYPQYWYLKK
jgi:peptide/nickel transport system substrate-binding protein